MHASTIHIKASVDCMIWRMLNPFPFYCVFNPLLGVFEVDRGQERLPLPSASHIEGLRGHNMATVAALEHPEDEPKLELQLHI